MDNRRAAERIEEATSVYEDTRTVQEELYDIEAELEADIFSQYEADERAQEHLQVARQALDRLAELMQHLHMRPGEDSSGAPLDASEANQPEI
jgi:ribosome assembly protein YihI (activator of Der GTPase)